MSFTTVLTLPRREKAAERSHTTSLAPDDARRLTALAGRAPRDVHADLGTTFQGLRSDQLDRLRKEFGPNRIRRDGPPPAFIQLLKTFTNPFVLILVFLCAVMFATDVLWADDGPSYDGIVLVGSMVLISVLLRFWQEHRSGRAVAALEEMVTVTSTTTRRHDGKVVSGEIPIDELLPGDVVSLAAGDMIPADVRVVRATHLQVNQSMLSGESAPVEKTAAAVHGADARRILDADNLAFMGTSVVSGSATAVVVNTGRRTYFGAMAKCLDNSRPDTDFDVGVRKVSYLLIRLMVVMVPAVFLINGLTKDWSQALLFGVATAVGLTPEMLPLIVTATLAKGAMHMSRHKVIVRRLGAIQNFGAMDVLCTDKTGTLTEDRIALAEHLDPAGQRSRSTLRLATVNAHFQTGLRNSIDEAVLAAAGKPLSEWIGRHHRLVDEIPFDFTRRRMSVVVEDGGLDLMVTKGAAEEVLMLCDSVLANDRTCDLNATSRSEIEELVARLNGEGKRVLAVARRHIRVEVGDRREYTRADESGLTLVGFLTFLDPPKASASSAVAALQAHGTAVKVITGDNELVTEAVCRKAGIEVGNVVDGDRVDRSSDQELAALVGETAVFVKIDPTQKARIVRSLKQCGNTVGFLGDGVNDAPALHAADVGISVHSAADIARESADIVLLEKDLGVLEHGVLEGRRTFGNMLKYVKMTASSNFGNVFTVLVASAMLPFLPMIPLVLLVQNLVYDLAMLALPWDRVDREYLTRPRKWETRSLARYIVSFGPISSIFDIATFAVMWFVFAANAPEHAALFQSGWFVESLLTQTLIVHVIRTRRIPFLQSRASVPLLVTTALACVFGLVLPFTGLGGSLGLIPLPWSYFPWLIGILAAYCATTQIAKMLFIRRGWM
jgi:Mg2+-importing ATPase